MKTETADLGRKLLWRIRVTTGLFMLALMLAGVTAIPLSCEVNWLEQLANSQGYAPGTSEAGTWLQRVRVALSETAERHSFLFYGTDWLAFGHFVIAIAFVGALRDPVRNSWLYRLGMIACCLVIPYAAVFGAIRGIPWWWRLIDCSFGVFGFIPMWLCNRWTASLARQSVSMRRSLI